MLCSRCSYQTALHKGVTTALRATAGFVYSITHTHTHTPTHTLPLFCISQTIVPIEPKFCMHMECDQSIKSHKNIKLIWGHLGYANEGQRSNLPLFCISETVGPIEPKFCMRMECDQTIKSHKNINLIWGHLGYANEGQRSNLPLFCISLTGDQFSPRFWYVVAETILYKDIWHLFFILMTSSQWNFLSQEPLVPLSPNFVCTWSVIRQLFHEITPTY